MSSPPAITSDTPIPTEPEAHPTTEPAPAPAPAPAPNTGCKGYLMAHHVYPPPPGTPIDPYAVVPCPHPTAVPPHLGERCKSNPRAKRTCGKCMYCPMHWCGFCKRAVKAAELATLAGEKTQVQEVQVEEVRPEGEAVKVKTD